MHIFSRAGGLLAVVLILLVNGLRFYQLERVPYGAQVDEMSAMVTVECLVTQGTDAWLRPFPLFGTEDSGPKPPTYMYPAAAWVYLFGPSIVSFRAFMAAVFLLMLVGLFVLGRKLFGNSYGVWVVLTASISPWTWNFSRIVYESPVALVYLVWGLVFLFIGDRRRFFFLAGIFLSGAMYSYPPLRLQIFLSIIPLLALRRLFGGLSSWQGGMLFLGLLGASLPLVFKIANGQLMSRFWELSIFAGACPEARAHGCGFMSVGLEFLRNTGLHFHPEYLFRSGDQNLVHATGRFGLLSWTDMLGLGALLFLAGGGLVWRRPVFSRKEFFFAGALFFCWLLAVVPAALTNEGLPHSLRSVGGAPFAALLTGFGLWKAARAFPFVWLAGGFLSALFFMALFRTYFYDYPQKSQGWFNIMVFEQARASREKNEWLPFLAMYRHRDVTTQYFLMREQGLSCRRARELWQGLIPLWRNFEGKDRTKIPVDFPQDGR